ncbi:MAG: hypothetical protein Q9191_000632 [Dirinaria sp. TL-2023a]
MRGGADGSAGAEAQSSNTPAFQIIVLGAGGGPSEDDVTGLLVRSTATQWAKRSLLAVDAGVHLAAILKIVKEHLPNAIQRSDVDADILSPALEKKRSKSHGNGAIPPRIASHSSNLSLGAASPISRTDTGKEKLSLELTTGPFAGYVLHARTAGASAVQILRELIPTYLISHPHLDHVSGLAINTASFQHTASRKQIAGLPSTVEAIKEHIFNDIMWPNLSDEDGGVGLVSYQRLQEGGSVAVGFGDSEGYIEVCDGLTVKCQSISHGKCSQNHTHRGGYPNSADHSQHYSTSRRGSRASTPPPMSHDRKYGYHGQRGCIIDSTAFFLRDEHTGKEVLIFGDVEPDSISLSPRTVNVWSDAAPKIANGTLTGILIECSYDDSQPDKALFGHLNPKHLIAELQVLAEKVAALKPSEEQAAARKRKRQSNGLVIPEDSVPPPSPVGRSHGNTHTSRRRKRSSVSPATRPSSDILMSPGLRENTVDGTDTGQADGHELQVPQGRRPSLVGALKGLRVIIIHVKDSLKDEPNVRDTIIAQLAAYENDRQLGCVFEMSRSCTSIWL